jgi:protein-histidine pros-kinase
MLITLSLGIALAAYLSRNILIENAKQEVQKEAELIMEAAKSIRAYTANEVRPILNRLSSEDVFLPHTVPAFAATESLKILSKEYPDYRYKEAALNPTNPADKALEWEAEVINHFRTTNSTEEFIGERITPNGPALSLSKPFKITNKACLVCHSTPENAPAAMIERYGRNNGFGWKHNEIIGAQIVSVPMSVPLERANAAFNTFMTALGAVFVAIWILLNVLLHFVVILPVRRMAENANQISLGELETPEFEVNGKDEIASLGNSFNRMYRSLTTAVKLLDETEV